MSAHSHDPAADLPDLAVTGSTGAVGGRVANRLAGAGLAQRLLVRDAARAPRLDGAAVLAFPGYGDRAGALDALRGVRTLLMVSASESPDRVHEHRTFIDAAAEAGVRRIVYTSFAGAASDSIFTLGRDHFATEQHVRASGMEWTFLRDNFYLDFLAHLAGEDGVVRGPAGDGTVAAVSQEDVAASAAAVLQDPGAHAGTAYQLTGPESLSFARVAEILTAARGRRVRYHDETVEEAYESRRQWPAPDWMYDAWVSTYTAIAAGEVAEVSDDVRTLTGRAPLSLEELLRRRS